VTKARQVAAPFGNSNAPPLFKRVRAFKVLEAAESYPQGAYEMMSAGEALAMPRSASS
jgi:hypothetical protein